MSVLKCLKFLNLQIFLADYSFSCLIKKKNQKSDLESYRAFGAVFGLLSLSLLVAWLFDSLSQSYWSMVAGVFYVVDKIKLLYCLPLVHILFLFFSSFCLCYLSLLLHGSRQQRPSRGIYANISHLNMKNCNLYTRFK